MGVRMRPSQEAIMLNLTIALDVLAHWAIAAPFLGALYTGARMYGRGK